MSTLVHLVKEEGERRKNENNMNLCRGCPCPKVILKWKLMRFIVISSNPLGGGVVVFLVDIERTLGIPPSQHQMCLPDGANIELLPEEPEENWFCIFKAMVHFGGAYFTNKPCLPEFFFSKASISNSSSETTDCHSSKIKGVSQIQAACTHVIKKHTHTITTTTLNWL